MKKLISFLLILLTLFIGLALDPQFSYATELVRERGNRTHLNNYPYYKTLPGVYTPASHTFVMQSGAETEVIPLQGNADSSQLTVNGNSPTGSVMIRNVGWYQGKKVSVKVSMLKNLTNRAGGTIFFEKERFLTLSLLGDVNVTYEFFDEENRPLKITTSVNSYDLSKKYYFGMGREALPLQAIYAYSPTSVFSRTWDDESGGYWVTYHNETESEAIGKNTQQVQILTQPKEKLIFIYRNWNNNQPLEIPYRTDFVAKPEFGGAVANSLTLEKPQPVSELKAQQIMPNVADDRKLSNLEVRFNLTNLLQSQQYELGDINIQNFNGEDVTALFSQEMQGEELVLTALQPQDSRLNATTLLYTVAVKWREGAPAVDNRFIDTEGNLALPYTIQTKATNRDKAFNQATEGMLKVNYNSKVNLLFVDENDQPLKEPMTQPGILTQAFDVSSEYPEIPGYYPVKNPVEQDQGTFQQEEQTIVHRYRKNLEFQLKNSGETIPVSRFNKEAEVAYSLKHEAGKTVRVMARFGGEEQLVKEYPTAPETVDDQVKMKIPDNWLDQEVEFYAMNETGQVSNNEKKILSLEKGPQLKLPDVLSFGQQEIPVKDSYVKLPQEAELAITDESQLDKSQWKVKVKMQQMMKNQNNQTLSKGLSFIKEGKRTPINDVEQTVA
ncbi:hypothetical protein E3441_002479, partial [Enterococcus faecalis]|nr:hypothetical protein [Enterococcus faecalis]